MRGRDGRYISQNARLHGRSLRPQLALPGTGRSRRIRVQHADNEFANGTYGVKGIESFWSFAKRRLVKFNGIPKHTVHLHLKETEFRFNHPQNDLYKPLLSCLGNNPL